MPKDETKGPVKVYETCPHCGQKLSPWQQVLLSVDRTLMCRHCWYRITLEVHEGGEQSPRKRSTEK